jgi:hypothetical protein
MGASEVGAGGCISIVSFGLFFFLATAILFLNRRGW